MRISQAGLTDCRLSLQIRLGPKAGRKAAIATIFYFLLSKSKSAIKHPDFY